MQDILQQDLRHFSHMFFLHAELANQHCQDPEVLRSDVGQGYVFEHFGDVEILVAGGEEAEIEDEAIEMSEDLVGWHFVEEGFELRNQLFWVLIDLEQADDGDDLLEGDVLGVLLLDPF